MGRVFFRWPLVSVRGVYLIRWSCIVIYPEVIVSFSPVVLGKDESRKEAPPPTLHFPVIVYRQYYHHFSETKSSQFRPASLVSQQQRRSSTGSGGLSEALM